MVTIRTISLLGPSLYSQRTCLRSRLSKLTGGHYNHCGTTEAILTVTSLQARPSPSAQSSNYKPEKNIIHNTTIKSELQMIYVPVRGAVHSSICIGRLPSFRQPGFQSKRICFFQGHVRRLFLRCMLCMAPVL